MTQKDLEFFKKLLEDRKIQIKKNIDDAASEVNGLRDSGVSDEFDIASINTDQLIEQSISAQQRAELDEIALSLSKIFNNTYGICEMCEEEIGMARLKVKPHARYCITCREIVEKTAKK
ncbi:RNA polymerase-binding protein DksA [Campylobacter sp. RM9344]|uniref:RNA polymerase-binding protein DksA n=1 Tax=Campylobacter californiensis TaxID=1032243 RepID=A0AAW3ZTP2_9BACT|nr:MULTISPECIES: RNA polymerase-binding protein DksA [unclassified Campylobacter]MBE2984395.1 RNA polymerase-binding protein DksA [Campylobacter sp. RM6883]MBE2985733.1 RNA polymerase-binding protein DksA [Campylobacter sp. RM12919]MBE2988747.1 RNA polymerase-binding protein DksA [Campylobacter sp. RM12920]MBE2995830.1 RNA polymerase-binding protein DksA [Campylobacter sp. RM6913]MBE3021781.1 RNA polymerase-binding protein DksA [Campylobacter sp. 7477a]MBE3029661.1 RNA polymerase-binding prot